jgi:hypothetical protein
MNESGQVSTVLAFVFLVICMAGMVAMLLWFDKLYYEPLCKRYGGAQQLTYHGFKPRYRRSRTPAKCIYLEPDAGADSKYREILVGEIPKTLRDYAVQVLRGIGVIVTGGATVWLVWQVGGFKKD